MEFHADMAALNCQPPDLEPRATDHVGVMVADIERMVASGHAYAAGGDVLFAVDSVEGYGRLSGRSLVRMLRAPRDSGWGLVAQMRVCRAMATCRCCCARACAVLLTAMAFVSCVALFFLLGSLSCIHMPSYNNEVRDNSAKRHHCHIESA